jgi:hypothetical protein
LAGVTRAGQPISSIAIRVHMCMSMRMCMSRRAPVR